MTLAQNSSLSIPSTVSAINSATPLSQRVVHYDIDAKYDAKGHTLEGTETLTYHNLTGQPLDTFPFHLYLNAFQPKSTWVKEGRREGTRDEGVDDWDDKKNGAEEIKSFEVVGQGDLTKQLQFIHPDDDNQDDKTVVQVHLNTPIPPDGYVQFKIRWHNQYPHTLARTGWDRESVVSGQWFPKVGVWWHGAWNCHQFHAYTEFFADFGVYDVKVALPQNEVVGGSGVKVSETSNSDGTKTAVFHGEDIHDFAWTASPNFHPVEDTFQSSVGPVKLIFLMMPAHMRLLDRHAYVLKQAMDRDDRWYGPYPYKTLTVVDTERDSPSFGMEYPTFFTAGSHWMNPAGVHIEPEETVEHEYGHQYWYGMVATNEFEDAWMDEGINSYNDAKVMDSIYPLHKGVFDLWGLTGSESDYMRSFYLAQADLDAIAKNGWDYANSGSYACVTYGKTASVLLTLEGVIGPDVMRQAMHTYFQRYKFAHPTKEDFLKTIEEVSGKNLRWYFDQAVYASPVLDYTVLKASSSPVEWYREDLKEKKGETEYFSSVWIQRKQDFVFPVETEIKFDNGESVREQWDGRDRWVRYDFRKKAKIESVEIDPDHKIYLDRNDYNNSYLSDPNGAPANKVTNYWRFISQFFAQFLAWWLV
jgi:aminopeptidase N